VRLASSGLKSRCRNDRGEQRQQDYFDTHTAPSHSRHSSTLTRHQHRVPPFDPRSIASVAVTIAVTTHLSPTARQRSPVLGGAAAFPRPLCQLLSRPSNLQDSPETPFEPNHVVTCAWLHCYCVPLPSVNASTRDAATPTILCIAH
jgi:hypothetical protein